MKYEIEKNIKIEKNKKIGYLNRLIKLINP